MTKAHRSWLVVGMSLLALGRASSASDRDDPAVLTMRDAVAAVLRDNPDLVALSAEMGAREAQALQAGLLPNPDLSVKVEDVGGSGDRESFERTETTLLLSQVFELGGQRGRREALFRLNRDLTDFDYASTRLALSLETTKAFIATLGAQERLDLAVELEAAVIRAVDTVQAHVRAGGAAEIDLARARVTSSRVRVGRMETERSLAAARNALAALWGASQAEFTRAAGDLTVLPPVPPCADLLARTAASPEVARWATELEERSASLALAQAEAIPDVALSAGARHFSDNGDNALVFEVAVPLPVFDRNQGAIEEAHQRLGLARARRDATEREVRAALIAAYERLVASRDRATLLRDGVLPDAGAVQRLALDNYEKGLFRYLDVLDAQQTFVELSVDYIRALEAAHTAAADIERLTAAPLGAAPEGEQP